MKIKEITTHYRKNGELPKIDSSLLVAMLSNQLTSYVETRANEISYRLKEEIGAPAIRALHIAKRVDEITTQARDLEEITQLLAEEVKSVQAISLYCQVKGYREAITEKAQMKVDTSRRNAVNVLERYSSN